MIPWIAARLVGIGLPKALGSAGAWLLVVAAIVGGLWLAQHLLYKRGYNAAMLERDLAALEAQRAVDEKAARVGAEETVRVEDEKDATEFVGRGFDDVADSLRDKDDCRVQPAATGSVDAQDKAAAADRAARRARGLRMMLDAQLEFLELARQDIADCKDTVIEWNGKIRWECRNGLGQRFPDLCAEALR